MQYVAGLRRANAQLFTHVIDKPDSTKIHVIDRCLRLIELVDGDHKVDGLVTTHQSDTFHQKKISKMLTVILRTNSPVRSLLSESISPPEVWCDWGTENFKKLVEYLKEKKIEYLLLCSTRDIKLSLEIDPYSERTYYTPGFGAFLRWWGRSICCLALTLQLFTWHQFIIFRYLDYM